MTEVDIAIIETGMGGRLDSTNVILPDLSVITNVGMDHMKFLGSTVEEIAREKAGIIKDGVPVVLGQMNEKASLVCRIIAGQKNAKLLSVNDYQIEAPKSDLIGNYQEQNKKTAYLSCLELNEQGWGLSADAIQRGFMGVVANTGLKGRWQVLSEAPYTVVDVAHNEDGFKAIAEEISKCDFEFLHIVLGLSEDKASGNMLPLLPKNAIYYFCKPNIPRGMDSEILQEEATKYGLKGECYSGVAEAYTAARLQATKEDMIFIGGSFFVVAEVL